MQTVAEIAEMLRGEMEKAAKARDEFSRMPGMTRAESRAEGLRAGLAFAYDLVRGAVPAGGAP